MGLHRINQFTSGEKNLSFSPRPPPLTRAKLTPPLTHTDIIVGAGSAGASLAASLAEQNPTKTILLTDAGGSNQQFKVRQPFLTCPDVQNTELDFMYRTTPQELQQNRCSYWPRGKCLGGSSSLNFMLAVRGDRRGYDAWANEMGCPGWGWKDVEKYFIAMEDYTSTKRTLTHRGKRGAIGITDMRDIDFQCKPLCEAFVKGATECGLPPNEDYNGPVQTGAAISQANIKNGYRHDTASAYLFAENGAFAKCPNLHCITDEQCARVVMDESQNPPRAVAVEFISGFRVAAKCEILLCAGAVGSPQILLLSGIGPKAHLESKGIHCVVDLPGVGQNLKDHVMVTQGYAIKDEHSNITFNRKSPLDLARAFGQRLITGEGMLSTSWVQAMAFKDSSIQRPTDASGIQIHFVPFTNPDEELNKRLFGFDRTKHAMMSEHLFPANGITGLPSLLQPKSAGFVELASKDPKVHPIIDPK